MERGRSYVKVILRRLDCSMDWEWINNALPILQVEDTCGIVAIDVETNTPLAACAMDNWTANSVQCHLLVLNKQVLKYEFLETCFDFIFNINGRKFVYGLVPGNNAKALKLNEHIGFTEKCRFEGAFEDGVDYVILELKRENCKYLLAQEAA